MEQRVEKKLARLLAGMEWADETVLHFTALLTGQYIRIFDTTMCTTGSEALGTKKKQTTINVYTC